MRKHFLLLFLMALLPLAGWAAGDPVDITGYHINLSASEATYTSSDVLPTVTLKKANATDIAASAVNVVWKNSSNATVTTAVNVDTYTVTVTAKEGSSTGSLTTNTATFKVKKANLDINVHDFATPKVYGFKIADFTSTEAKSVWSVSTGTNKFLGSDSEENTHLTVKVDWGTDRNAGEHTFTLTANALANYNVNFIPSATGKWNIAKKNLTVTAEDANLTYGDPFVGSKYVDYVGFEFNETAAVLGGELTFTTEYVPGKPVNTYSWQPGGLTSSNYNISYNNGNIIVGKKDISKTGVVISDFANKTYNKKDQKPTTITAKYTNGDWSQNLTSAGYDLSYLKDITVNEETGVITGTTVTTITEAGTYGVKIDGKGNYEGTVYKTFTIDKKPLAVITKTIDPLTYNGVEQKLDNTQLFTKYVTFDGLIPSTTNPSFTGDEWGNKVGTDFGKSDLLADGKKLTLTLTKGRVATTAKDAYKYTIKVDGDADAFKNYIPQYVSTGIFEIARKTVTVTAKDQSKNHGATHLLDSEEGVQTIATPTTDALYYGNWVTITMTANASAATDAITTYPVVKKSADGTKTVASGLVFKAGSAANAEDITTKNYDVKYVNGKFTVNKGTISIIANAAFITYGDEEPAMTATIAGLAEGELTDEIQAAVNAKVSIKQAKHTDAGTYDLVIAADVKNVFPAKLLANYNETINLFYDSNKYTVKQKPLTKITALQQSLAVGDAQSALVANEFTVDIEGAKEADLNALYTALTGKLKFADYVNKGSQTDPLLTAVPDADVTDKFVKATSTYLKGIIFDTTADLGNYTFPMNGTAVDATKVIAGNLVVSAANAAFTFDINATATTQITANVAKKLDATISNATTKRTLWANEWNAIVLPFDITPYKFIEAIGTYAIFDVMQTSGTAMNFKITINSIPAYTPFLVKVDKDVVLNGKPFNDVTIKPIDETALAVANDAYIFQGNLAKNTPVPAWIVTANSKGKGGIDLYHNVEGGTNYPCYAFSAYIKAKPATPANQAPVIYIEEADGSTTAITAINAEGVAVKADGWYTLNGIKLNAAPTEKGIYINNGKKVVIK